MPRFVVLIHDHPVLHWDFMLEKEAVLRTWRLARPPVESGPILAEPLPDHRLAYLDYEGPLSGDRGSVRRYDRGDYLLLEETGERVVVELKGTLLQGKAVIERRGPAPGWEFCFTPDHGHSSTTVGDDSPGTCRQQPVSSPKFWPPTTIPRESHVDGQT